PLNIWDKITELGYNSPTVAVITALERMVDEHISAGTTNTQETPEDTEEDQEIPVYKELLTEKERHIETLKSELATAERDKEDLKATYNNYFLQIQTLINQKNIAAPGEPAQIQDAQIKKAWWKFW
ncbi:MAG: hypothetical protein QUS12_07940, partial [Methanosarcina sp.]|nr:hypothetical protein [Methanosarcina sp.]